MATQFLIKQSLIHVFYWNFFQVNKNSPAKGNGVNNRLN